jgi:DNA-binding response OmpR family regulator
LPHVFDRFFQADGNDHASGYGIGLSLVREIVQAHGGNVQVTSTVGVGSTFTLSLPLAEGEAVEAVVAQHEPRGAAAPDADSPCAAAVALAPSPATSIDNRERLLIVEDHDDMRARLVELMQPRFEVLAAADGNEAWRLARDELPDLIVSDVMMPGCDGVELTRRLRAHAETDAIGVLLLTAKVGSEHAVLGLSAGANDYLEKPFDASELLARCEAILAHARRLRHRLAVSNEPMVQEAPIESSDQRWRQRVDATIAKRLSEPEFDIETLADALHVDRSQLFRRLKELAGVSPSDYLRDARLARARELLLSGAGNISEVAYASGFQSLSSFTRAFKARYGEPPSQVRKAAS